MVRYISHGRPTEYWRFGVEDVGFSHFRSLEGGKSVFWSIDRARAERSFMEEYSPPALQMSVSH